MQVHSTDTIQRATAAPFTAFHVSGSHYLRLIKIGVGVIFVPIKLIFRVLFLFLCFVVCWLSLLGVEYVQQTPILPTDSGLPHWRSRITRIWAAGMSRLVLVIFGFLWIDLDQRAVIDSKLICCNHQSYIDILFLVAMMAPSFVAKSEVATMPLIGTCARALQCIFVRRGDPDSRSNVLKTIEARLGRHHTKEYPSIAVFPEGTTTNGCCIVKFQKGVFTLRQPIQPLAIQFTFNQFNPAWTSSESTFDHLLTMLSQAYNRALIVVLPIYEPSSSEKDDAHSYAIAMQHLVAETIGLPCSTLSMYDSPMLSDKLMTNSQKSKSVNMVMFSDPDCCVENESEICLRSMNLDSDAFTTNAEQTVTSSIPGAVNDGLAIQLHDGVLFEGELAAIVASPRTQRQ